MKKHTREQIQKVQKILTNLQPHIPQACKPGHEQFIDNHVDFALELIKVILEEERAAPEAEIKKTDEFIWLTEEESGLAIRVNMKNIVYYTAKGDGSILFYAGGKDSFILVREDPSQIDQHL